MSDGTFKPDNLVVLVWDECDQCRYVNLSPGQRREVAAVMARMFAPNPIVVSCDPLPLMLAASFTREAVQL